MAQPEVTYVHADGTREVIKVEPGSSVMMAATSNGVRGIIGECGGAAMCATCHVYVDPGVLASFGPMEEDEDEMLAETAAQRKANSRLSCQLVMGEGVDEITVEIPDRQGTL